MLIEFVIMIGSTLSGKTTYCKRIFSNHEHISLENFRFNRKSEDVSIEEQLKARKSVVIDDTNLTRKIRKTHIDLAKKYNAKVIGVYMNVTRDVLASRRWKRPDNTNMIVINKMLKEIEIPEKEEGFEELHVIDQR